jgi:hypothetical protein
MLYYHCFSTLLQNKPLGIYGAHQLLAYDDDDVNLLGDNKGTINKNTETLMIERRLV